MPWPVRSARRPWVCFGSRLRETMLISHVDLIKEAAPYE